MLCSSIHQNFTDWLREAMGNNIDQASHASWQILHMKFVHGADGLANRPHKKAHWLYEYRKKRSQACQSVWVPRCHQSYHLGSVFTQYLLMHCVTPYNKIYMCMKDKYAAVMSTSRKMLPLVRLMMFMLPVDVQSIKQLLTLFKLCALEFTRANKIYKISIIIFTCHKPLKQH